MNSDTKTSIRQKLIDYFRENGASEFLSMLDQAKQHPDPVLGELCEKSLHASGKPSDRDNLRQSC